MTALLKRKTFNTQQEINNAQGLVNNKSQRPDEYKTKIILSEYTYEHINHDILCRQLDLVAVKGKARPVKIYEALALMEQSDSKMKKFAEMFLRGINHYHNREFSQAVEIFNAINKVEKGDAPSRVYIQRCLEYMKEPPPDDWDGVFRLKTK